MSDDEKAIQAVDKTESQTFSVSGKKVSPPPPPSQQTTDTNE